MVYHARALHNYFIPCVANTITETFAQRMVGRLDLMLSNVQRLSCVLSDWLYFLLYGVTTFSSNFYCC